MLQDIVGIVLVNVDSSCGESLYLVNVHKVAREKFIIFISI